MNEWNILFVTFDQFRADCLTGALAAHVDLPNLQALRREAVTFANHFSVSSPCGPARASLLTGQYACNHGSVRNGTPLRHDTPTLPGELRAAGYAPALFGYTDTSRDPRSLPEGDPALKTYEEAMPGFDELLEMRYEQSDPWRAALATRGYDVPPGKDLYKPLGDRPNGPALYRAEDSDTAYLTDCALAALDQREPGWCAHLSYLRPHPPLVAPAPYNDRYDPAKMPPPLTEGSFDAAGAAHPFVAAHLSPRTIARTVVGFPDLAPTAETVATLRAIYFGLMTELDHHIGRLIDWLKASGQFDRTLILITSDHGEMLGDHHDWGKQTFHDASFHVPLIIRDPKHPAGHGKVVGAPTESIDVMPTILDWIGHRPPDTVNGHSLRPFLQGQDPRHWRQNTFSEFDFGNPLLATREQRALGLDSSETGVAILRTPSHRLVQFGADLPQIVHAYGAGAIPERMSSNGATEKIFLDLSRKMLCHRMANPTGLFARTLITPYGPMTGNAPRNT